MLCEKCGNALREGAKFCTKCGAKVEDTPVQAVQLPLSDSADAVLSRINMASYYEGIEKMKPVAVNGELILYRDAIEFKRNYLASGYMAFGLIGAGIAASKQKKEPPIRFPLAQIQSVEEGKQKYYMHVRMKNGDAATFVAGIGGGRAEELKKMIAIAQQLLGSER